MAPRTLLPDLPAYAQLQAQAAVLKSASIERLFDKDRSRAETFSVAAAGLHLDYSKHLLNTDTLSALLRLAEQAGVREGISALFSGAHVNSTEDRPALHTLLRASSGGSQTERFAEVVTAFVRA